MNKQDRTIKAIEILIKDRYTDGKYIDCPLCKIFYDCIGCPNHVFRKYKEEFAGCTHRKTLKIRSIRNSGSLQFWQQALPELWKLPSWSFTKKGYKDEYFKFLVELDNKIAES